MEIRIFQNDKRNRIAQFMLMYLTIYFGRDTLVNTQIGMLASYIVLEILVLGLVIKVLMALIQKQIGFKDLKKRFLFLIVCACLAVLSMFFNHSFTFRYITLLFAIGLAVLMTLFFERGQFYKTYSKVICFYVISSMIITYVIGDSIVLITMTNAAGLRFSNLILGYVPLLDNYVRNFSIFREPGVFQFFILLALYYDMMVMREKGIKNKIEIIVLVLGLISTFSVSGFACFAVLVLAYILKEENLQYVLEHKKQLFKLGVVAILGIIALLYFNDSVYWMVHSMIEKIKGLGVNDPRVSSIIANSSLFVQSPIVGNDVNNVLAVVEHNTCSLLVIFATFGIGFGSLITYIWMRLIEMNRNTMIEKIKVATLVVFFFLLLNNQCLITNIYLYAFPIFNILANKVGDK